MATIVLSIPGIAGECEIAVPTAQLYKTLPTVGGIMCDSMNQDIEVEMEVSASSRRTVHTPKVNNITLERKYDSASIALIQSALTSKIAGTATNNTWAIYCLKATGEDTSQWGVMLTIVLVNPLFAKHSLSVSESDTTESIEINATDITWIYTKRDETQKATATNTQIEFNVLTGSVVKT
ncbi:MAG: type VI secretion system tube protein Hcp [Azospirillaceae bacterium]|nr:type VI secretion system tube protein Hcp [Azospirillaceae bacterium]